MATTVLFRIPADAAEMYDSVNQEMGVDQNNLPDGLIHHYATKTSDEFVTFDLWQSREDFERLSNEKLRPALEKVAGDLAAEGEPTFGELHNEFTGSS